jgi:glycine betaine/choline ABC-type transport system substrate-binding protein
MTDAFASASKAGKGMAVRDALTSAYPRLAQLLEATFDRLTSETTMKVNAAALTYHRHDMI